MFNAEQLLGKIVRETLGNTGGGSGLVDSLGSGTALMTVIGLGVGAYEILSEQKDQAPKGGATPPPLPIPGRASAPPPPPPPTTGKAPASPAAQPGQSDSQSSELSPEELAKRMIQAMIGAAHADGTLDEEEEQAILDKLRGAELSREEKMFLLDELRHPRTVDELTKGITDPAAAKTMYLLAAGAIKVDTEAERQWLDELGNSLGLSVAVRTFLEEQAGTTPQDRP
ncbi:MAG TPA: DUF533 domain-containing protein [Desulfobulbus sp.]|nr:DUF533 domain-containing protein [Desulfobulbus sp.]